jgi:hypothetical protein
MKKANIVTESGVSYNKVNVVKNVADLMDAHECIFGSEFGSELRKILLNIKTKDDITPKLESVIRRSKLAPQTHICILNQLNTMFEGFYLAMNDGGGYFNFKPETTKIVELRGY